VRPVLGLVESLLLTTRHALSKGPTVPTNRRTDPADTQAAEDEPTSFEIPEDLTSLDDAELEALLAQATEAFDAFAENEHPSADDVAAITQLGAAISEIAGVQQERADEAQRLRDEFASVVAGVRGSDTDPDPDGGTDPDDDHGDPDGGQGDEPPAEVPAGDATPAADAPADTPVPVAASARRGPLRIETPVRRGTLNPSLGQIAAHAPDPGIEDPRPEVVITAAADVPRLSPGQRIPTMQQLVDATVARSKALGVTNGQPAFVPLASINREFPLTFDERDNPDSIRHQFEELVADGTTRSGMEALVAAGGWCAPSEIRYDFFQISEVAGLIDLPTFGVRRGGLRWPQSLSLADFFALAGAPASGIPTAATMPWEWTEASDIAAATGSPPSKLCLRPDCPSFDEARLTAYGICVTAGNLTEDAFPELIRHFIAQTVVAHARAINRRIIATMAAASTGVTPTSLADQGATTHILGATDLQATDYREKHGMRDTAVLELVVPSWLKGLMRSDIAKQNGVGLEKLAVVDSMLRDWFDARDVRVQFVQDWQTRNVAGGIAAPGAAPTNWPTSAQGMLYAPGTFGRGNGMTLDLGVVRDSVLNAKNDHTAAWSEEATLVAKFGHESRLITYSNLEATGTTGPQATLASAFGP
jgi:hypothetical protein